MLNGLVSSTWGYKGSSYDGRGWANRSDNYWLHFRKDKRKKDAEQLPFETLEDCYRFIREVKPYQYGISSGLSWIENNLTD